MYGENTGFDNKQKTKGDIKQILFKQKSQLERYLQMKEQQYDTNKKEWNTLLQQKCVCGFKEAEINRTYKHRQAGEYLQEEVFTKEKEKKILSIRQQKDQFRSFIEDFRMRYDEILKKITQIAQERGQEEIIEDNSDFDDQFKLQKSKAKKSKAIEKVEDKLCKPNYLLQLERAHCQLEVVLKRMKLYSLISKNVRRTELNEHEAKLARKMKANGEDTIQKEHNRQVAIRIDKLEAYALNSHDRVCQIQQTFIARYCKDTKIQCEFQQEGLLQKEILPYDFTEQQFNVNRVQIQKLNINVRGKLVKAQKQLISDTRDKTMFQQYYNKLSEFETLMQKKKEQLQQIDDRKKAIEAEEVEKKRIEDLRKKREEETLRKKSNYGKNRYNNYQQNYVQQQVSQAKEKPQPQKEQQKEEPIEIFTDNHHKENIKEDINIIVEEKKKDQKEDTKGDINIIVDEAKKEEILINVELEQPKVATQPLSSNTQKKFVKNEYNNKKYQSKQFQQLSYGLKVDGYQNKQQQQKIDFEMPPEDADIEGEDVEIMFGNEVVYYGTIVMNRQGKEWNSEWNSDISNKIGDTFDDIQRNTRRVGVHEQQVSQQNEETQYLKVSPSTNHNPRNYQGDILKFTKQSKIAEDYILYLSSLSMNFSMLAEQRIQNIQFQHQKQIQQTTQALEKTVVYKSVQLSQTEVPKDSVCEELTKMKQEILQFRQMIDFNHWKCQMLGQIKEKNQLLKIQLYQQQENYFIALKKKQLAQLISQLTVCLQKVNQKTQQYTIRKLRAVKETFTLKQKSVTSVERVKLQLLQMKKSFKQLKLACSERRDDFDYLLLLQGQQ